jgi:hypothetical protein
MDLVQDMIMIFTWLSKTKIISERSFFYSGIKTYNHFPKTIKELSHDVKQLRLTEKIYYIKFLLFFGRVF